VDSPNYLEAVKSNVAKVTSLLSGAGPVTTAATATAAAAVVVMDQASLITAPPEATHRPIRADSVETVGDDDIYSSSDYSPAMRLSGIPPHGLFADHSIYILF
jgi:hypothetical protein